MSLSNDIQDIPNPGSDPNWLTDWRNWKKVKAWYLTAAANPTASIGLTTVNGTALTFMRSDAAPPLSQAIAPTWTGIHTWAPATDITPTVIKGSASQTAALTAWKNNAGTLLAEVKPTGRIHTKEDFEIDDTFGLMSATIGRTYFFDAGAVNPSSNGWTVDQYSSHDALISDGVMWKHYADDNDNHTAEYAYRTLAATPNSIQMSAGISLSELSSTDGLDSTGTVAYSVITCATSGAYTSRAWKAGIFFKSHRDDGVHKTITVSVLFVRNEVTIEYSNSILVKSLVSGDIPYSYSYAPIIRVDQAGANVLQFYVNNVLVYTTVSDANNNLTKYVGIGFARNSYSGVFETDIGYGSNYYAYAASGLPISEGDETFLTKRSGNNLQVGDNNYWSSITYQVPGAGTHSFKAGTTEYFGIGASGSLTGYSLIGTGTRITTATATGVLGNSASIDGAYTWTGIQTLSALTASRAVFTDGAKNLVSNAITGSGNVVMSSSPTLTGTITAAVATFSGQITSTVSGGGASSGLMLSSTAGAVGWYQTDGSADNKAWDFVAVAERLILRTINDAGSASALIMDVHRSGNTVTTIQFPNGTAVFTNTITGAISGNAGTATALQTARTINTVSFDGTANIVVTAAAGTLTGAALNATVTASSLTSVGILANLTVTNPITGSITGNAATVTTNANLTGPVTSVGNATSVTAAAITSAMLRNSGALSVIGRSANSSGAPADISATAASDSVLRESGSVIGFGTIATAGITNSAVTLAKIANIADQTILGNNSGGAAAPIALTAAQTKTVLSLGNVENTALSTWAGTANITTLGTVATGAWGATAIAETKGGTNQTSYALGDTLYASAANTLSKLAGSTTSTIKFLAQTGTGTVSAAPAWNAATGTGSVVLSASPTLTGTLTAAIATFSGQVTIGSDADSSGTGLVVDGASAATRNLLIGQSAGINRVIARLDTSNNFVISARDNTTGAAIDIPFAIALDAGGAVSTPRSLLVGSGTSNPAAETSDITIGAGSSGNVVASLTTRGFRTTNAAFGQWYAYHGSSLVGKCSWLRANSSDTSAKFSIFTANAGALTSQFSIDYDGSASLAATLSVSGIITANSDVKIGNAGSGLYLKEGANCTMGTATLVLGTKVVTTTKVTASSRIFLSPESLGTITSPVAVAVTARSAGTSFTITSANLTDTSVIAWVILEPA